MILAIPAAQAQETERVVPASREQMQLSFAPVVKQVTPAVVNIYTKRRVQVQSGISPFMQDPFFRQFFGNRFGGMTRERVVSSLGSGVIVDPRGVIVTSNHVIEGSEDIIAVLADGREFSAKVVTADASSDLALLRLNPDGASLPALKLADSDTLEIGDMVLAVGNPFGVGQTVTSGIVSALARSAAGVSDYQFFIQTDAAINPGNSGGALVDMQGRLVGINTAIYSQSGGSNGIGFAIPSTMVNALLRNVQSNGTVVRPWLGASYRSVDHEVAESLGLDLARGALVEKIMPGSPAAEAGIEPGDVITGFGGSQVENADALKFRVAVAELNRSVEVELHRDGQTLRRRLQLAAPPEIPARDSRTLKGNHPLAGVTVINLSPRVASDYSLPLESNGVVVAKAGPQRGNFTMQPGDIILRVNGTAIRNTQQLERLLSAPARGWKITFQRGENMLELSMIP